MVDILMGAAIILLGIKVIILERDVQSLYRAICWLDGAKEERRDDE